MNTRSPVHVGDPIRVADQLHQKWSSASDYTEHYGEALKQEVKSRLGPQHSEEQFNIAIRMLVERRAEQVANHLGLIFSEKTAAKHQIGKGGYGFVFKAKGKTLNSLTVALKLLNPLLIA